MRLRLSLATAVSLLGGCAEGARLDQPDALGPRILAASPETLVDGTVLHFAVDGARDDLLGVRLAGTLNGRPYERSFPIRRGEGSAAVHTDPLSLPVGTFVGTAQFDGLHPVRATPASSAATPVHLRVVDSLRPELTAVEMPEAAYNGDPVRLVASALLLGGAEGYTTAEVEACRGEAGPDVGTGSCLHADVDVSAAVRNAGTFELDPAAFGLLPGRVHGAVVLRNEHHDGATTRSEARPFAVTIVPPALNAPSAPLSVGRLTEVTGGGFVSGDAVTLVELQGQLLISGEERPLLLDDISLVADTVDSRHARLVLHDDDGLGVALAARGLDIRTIRGTIDGRARLRTQGTAAEVSSPWVDVAWPIEPVRQVVHVVFADTFHGALALYGVQEAASAIEERVIEVMARDYDGVGVELRRDAPEDYAHYTTIVIGGPDPNGRDYFGLDNSPGKDVGNRRLYDHVGGYNADSEFGGVFVESFMVHYSAHPPTGLEPSTATTPSWDFDALFDATRPDGGTPLHADELPEGALRGFSTAGCPAAARSEQVRCAAGVVANMTGSTASHELAHALGLANPEGTAVHHAGDAPRRLMDAGGARPFRERAELGGDGPAVFCAEAFAYLQRILPPAQAGGFADAVSRPPC